MSLHGGNGAPDDSYGAYIFDGIESRDVAHLPDGSTVAVGHRISVRSAPFYGLDRQLVVFRRDGSGARDSGFATNGIFEWRDDTLSEGRALALEPDGRIVVAGVGYVENGGATDSVLLVLRLLPQGEPDPAFATAGLYLGPVVSFSGTIRLARTATGDYRLTAATREGCIVVGLTAAGVLDTDFGDAGISVVSTTQGNKVTCEAIQSTADGGILVAGSARNHGFVARLLANGAPESSFSADPAIAESTSAVTAATALAGGKLLVAGTGLHGAAIFRLQANGGLDATIRRRWPHLDRLAFRRAPRAGRA